MKKNKLALIIILVVLVIVLILVYKNSFFNETSSEINLTQTPVKKVAAEETTISDTNHQYTDFDEVDLSDKNLSGVDLTGKDLSGFDLSDSNLTASNLTQANLTGANLSGANLIRVNLSGANLTQANLTGTNLSAANLSGLDLRKTPLIQVNLTGANLSGANLSGLDLSRGSGFILTKLTDTNLSGANLIGIDLSGATLTGVNLTGTNLTGVDLTGINLSDVNLSKTNLSSVDLSEVDLSGKNLSGANLSNVDLRNKDLTGTNLSSANLINTDLSGAYLTQANISRTNLSGANLSDADLSGANLSDANLSGAKKIQMSVQNTSHSYWPEFNEIQNLNVTNYDLGEDTHYFSTKEGFLYELINKESKIVLNLNNDAQFPFANSAEGEGGLLNVISNNKFIYISYTSQDLNESLSLVVDEYSMDFSKVRNIIKIDGFPKPAGHIGGALSFDKLGRLYLSVGDGGPQGDPENHAQNLNSLRGKILRVDVSKLKLEPEIVAYGLRNPWGVSIDSNDRMFILNCGWSSVESVYLLNDLNSDTPSNFGWPVFQGTKRMRKDDLLIFQDTSSPIYEYINRPGCAIGGFYLDYLELLLFGDFYGTVRMLKQQKNGKWNLFHEFKQENIIWSLGFDKKTEKIFIGPNSLELKVSIAPFKLDEKVELCRTTMPNGSINNSGCN